MNKIDKLIDDIIDEYYTSYIEINNGDNATTNSAVDTNKKTDKKADKKGDIDNTNDKTNNDVHVVGVGVANGTADETVDGMLFSKIFKDINFVKYQIQINNTIENHIKKFINIEELKRIVGTQEKINRIIDIVTRYIAYYVFLTIGLYYVGKKESFTNNIIDISKNQANLDFKIKNFFNPENNAIIIKYYTLIKDIDYVINLSENDLKTLDIKKYNSVVNLLNEYGVDYVNKNLKGRTKYANHNIIKTIIMAELYIKLEKKEIFMILEDINAEKGEVKYIDIVIQKIDSIDYNIIENLLTITQIRHGIANELYDMLNDYIIGGDVKKISVIDEKILRLIENKIIVPIVDDFLRYHKDSEHADYDKQDKRDKKDTKIKHIVVKTELASELYSENIIKNKELLKEAEKKFYQPLQYRKAILVNDLEEIKIINKLHNQGIKSIKNNEYYPDLINHRMYPYNNFKDIKGYGFNIILDKTIDLLRYSTIEFISHNMSSSRNHVQLRIGSKDMNVNVVGLMIPTMNKHLYCQKTSNLRDIRNIEFNVKEDNKIVKKKYSNGYKIMQKYFKYYIFNSKTFNNSVYWMFDLTKDLVKVKSYEQLTKLNDHDNIKFILGQFYDDLSKNMMDHVYHYFDKKGELYHYMALKILKNINKHMFNLDTDSEEYNELLKYAYFKVYKRVTVGYDHNEDKIPGITGKLIKIIKYEPPKVTDTIILNVTSIKKIGKTESTYMEHDAICQHNITWEKMMILRRKFPTKFMEELYSFMDKYVIISEEQEYICKSCSILLPIKQFVQDGVYDNDQGRFVTFYTQIDTAFEELPEYEKYSKTIKNLDKQIERLCAVIGIPIYVGSARDVRNNRRDLTKNSIDIILVHNAYMRNINLKQRADIVSKKYGIDRDISNLFVFDLDNNIYGFSSREKDYYKDIKINNILIYVCLNIIIELSEQQVMGFVGDKICNFFLFHKFGIKLFERLNIRKNYEGDIVPITTYPVLCFVLYYFSCLLIRFKIWNYEQQAEEGKKKVFNPILQKAIIYTMVDVLNSILEVTDYGQKQKGYLYKIFMNKFYFKANSLGKNAALYTKLETIKHPTSKKIASVGTSVGKSVGTSGATFTTQTKLPDELQPRMLTGKYEHSDNHNDIKGVPCVMPFVRPPITTTDRPRLRDISSTTNCDTGDFHSWKFKDGEIICMKCGAELNGITIGATSEVTSETKGKGSKIETLKDKYMLKSLYNVINKFCTNGSHDNAELQKLCNKCQDTNNCTREDIMKIKHDFIDIKDTLYVSNIGKTNNDKDIYRKSTKNGTKRDDNDGVSKGVIEGDSVDDEGEIREQHNIINSLMRNYNKENDNAHKFGFIDKFIETIHNIIGKNVNINNTNTYMKYNTYVIMYDYRAISLNVPIIINENENIIKFKDNHDFFKKDVLYFINKKEGDIQIFYDAITNIYLGYKKQNQDYVINTNKNVYIKVNYSIYNKLLQLGYTGKHIPIEEKIQKYRQYYKDDDDMIMKLVVGEISRDRINNLIKITNDFQRCVYQIKFNYESNSLTTLVETYKEKLKNMRISPAMHAQNSPQHNGSTSGTRHNIFDEWKVISSGLHYQSNMTINLNTKMSYLNIDDIVNYDMNGNLILYYLTEQLNTLININTEKFVKTNLVYLFINMISHQHSLYNTELMSYNYEIKRFYYLLESDSLAIDTERQAYDMDRGSTDNLYGEYMDESELNDEDRLAQLEDDKESENALDIDNGIDDSGEPGSDEFDYLAESMSFESE